MRGQESFGWGLALECLLFSLSSSDGQVRTFRAIVLAHATRTVVAGQAKDLGRAAIRREFVRRNRLRVNALAAGADAMGIELNHTIVWCTNQNASARFLAEMLGRPAPTRFSHFDVVELDNGVSLDFADAPGPIRPQHYAFLISEADFDAVFGRIKDGGLGYWADPRSSRLGEINHNDGGRGVYFRDPDGHYFEVIPTAAAAASYSIWSHREWFTTN